MISGPFLGCVGRLWRQWKLIRFAAHQNMVPTITDSVLQLGQLNYDDLSFLGCIDGLGQVSNRSRLALKLPLSPRRAMSIVQASQQRPSEFCEIRGCCLMMEEDDHWGRP